MVPALIILALWVVLLAPGVLRWFREHQPTTSIASFHRQLRLLEDTGPKLVEPAYRLEGSDGQATEWQEAPMPTKAPRLVLLTSGPTQKESTMRYGDHYEADPDDRYDAAAAWDDPWGADDPSRQAYDPPTRAQRTVRAPRAVDYDRYDDDLEGYETYESDDVAGLSPERAAMRRRRIMVGLGATIGATFVLGLLPGLGILWAVTFLSILAMVGYLGLMLYASNTGMYGGTTVSRDDDVPVARVVMPTFQGSPQGYDDYDDFDDGWDQGRIAAAR